MTSGGLCRVEDFVWCSLCRRLAGCRGVYFPSRRFRDADVKCMSVYIARLQNYQHTPASPSTQGPYHIFHGQNIKINIYLYIYINIYIYIYKYIF